MKVFFALLALTAGSLMAQNPTITEIKNNYGGNVNDGVVAQGAIFFVKGTNMADLTTETLQNVPLLRNLRGTEIRITVNGVTTTAPLYYAFNTQVAGILPSNTPLGTGTLVVVNNGKTSAPRSITVIRSGFGMLTVSGDGTGLAAVHDPNYVLLSNTNASRPGMNVVFYGSGMGGVNQDETQVQTAHDFRGEFTVTVNIGGVNATVLYAGRTQFPGLDQINVTIPQLQTYSCTVAVTITTNGVPANAGTIPVTQSGTTCQQSGGGGGGNNSGIDITQEEINRWISQGSYTTGNIGTSRATIYSVNEAGVTSMSKEDFMSAGFNRVAGADLARLLRGELGGEFAQFIPQVGGCVVYTGVAPPPFPQITNTSLDAGASITANGPNGSLVAPRSIQSGFISYSAEAPGNYLASGNYTFTGTGGPGAGAFTGNMNIGTEFVVTNNPDDFKTITRSNPLTIRWTGGDTATNVQIFGFSFPANNGVPGTSSFFFCLANNSAGQFTVPASILNQLPASGKIEVPGFSIVFRGSLSVSTSNRGNRVSIPNIDYGAIAHSWSWAYSPEYK